MSNTIGPDIMSQSLTCHPLLNSVIVMKKIVLLIMLSCLLWPSYGYSVVVSGLYEAEVPVADQSNGSRKRGISTALRSVLVKLSGDRNVFGRNATDYVIEHAENYVQQYEYRTKNVDKDEPQASKRQLFLWVNFNANVLDEVLRKNGIPVWGKERPTTLVWLTAQNFEYRRLIGLEDETGYMKILDERASQRGIALIYPLLDLEDTSRLKASDIWGGFSGPIIDASERYNTDAILTGSIEPLLENLWEGRWVAMISGQSVTWSSQGELPDIVLDEGIDGLADLLAQRFAQAGGNAYVSGVEIIVDGIDNYDHYTKVLKYLSSLNSVTNVEVKIAEISRVTFVLTAHGGEVAIAQAINLGNILESTTGVGNAYRLLP